MLTNAHTQYFLEFFNSFTQNRSHHRIFSTHAHKQIYRKTAQAAPPHATKLVLITKSCILVIWLNIHDHIHTKAIGTHCTTLFMTFIKSPPCSNTCNNIIIHVIFLFLHSHQIRTLQSCPRGVQVVLMYKYSMSYSLS